MPRYRGARYSTVGDLKIFTKEFFHSCPESSGRSQESHMSKLKFLANFPLAVLLITGLHSAALAQSNIAAKASGIPTQPASTAAESDRAKDGLAGPVRRVRTETAKLLSTAGKTTEEKRVVLEVASYDLKGTKTENQYFPVSGSALTGKEVYKYDEKGNISEMTVLSQSGSLLSKEVYKYDYDSVGNWTRMTTSVAVIEGGNVTFEPTEVTYRSIMYYLDENMLRLAQPSSAVVTAPANTTNATVKAPGPEVKSVPVTKPQLSSASNRAPGSPQTATHAKPAAALPSHRVLATTSFTSNAAPFKLASASEAPKSTVVAMESEPPPAPAPKPLKPVSGGALNGRALTLPQPAYPDPARRARQSGMVTVEVVVDETGRVLSATATSGPTMLREAAIQAALRAKFSPTMLSGQPVKVTGTINYKFTLAQ